MSLFGSCATTVPTPMEICWIGTTVPLTAGKETTTFDKNGNNYNHTKWTATPSHGTVIKVSKETLSLCASPKEVSKAYSGENQR